MNKEGKITLESLQTVDISKLDSNAKDLYLGIIQLINERDIANKKLEDLKKVKEPTICGYSVEEVITILNGLELERKLDMKMTMDNLSLLAEKIHKDFANSIEKTLKKACSLGVIIDE